MPDERVPPRQLLPPHQIDHQQGQPEADANRQHVAGAGYYRATFQTYEFNTAVCGKYFEVLDFIERCMRNLQDIYVLRSRQG